MGKKLAIGGIGIIALLVGAAVVFFLARPSAPDAFELETTAEDETNETESAEPVDIEGAWTIADGSEAGYRVVEDFIGGIQDFEAVGRGSDIEGSITIEGSSITEASFEIEIATLDSRDANRNMSFQNIMNVDEYPTATFVLTEPIELGETPAPNSPVSTTATGDLTLRGVTNNTPVTIDAQLTGGQIEIVGSIEVLFSDYNIDNPSVERIIAVRDDGLVEFQLFLAR